jgi:hypothetical protein
MLALGSGLIECLGVARKEACLLGGLAQVERE